MRRMYSDGQVVKVVNKAIDDGEIQAGGLPEIEAGDAGKALVVNQAEDGAEWAEVGAPDNVLVLPEVAPASQQLVGINTSGEQNALGIGTGLEIANNALNAKILELDFNGGNSATVAQEVATNIQNKYYSEIIIKNARASSININVIHLIARNPEQDLYVSAGQLKVTQTNWIGNSEMLFRYFKLTVSGTNVSLSLQLDSYYPTYSQVFNVGTNNWNFLSLKNLYINQIGTCWVQSDTDNNKRALIYWDSASKSDLQLLGHAHEYDYTTGSLVATYLVKVDISSGGVGNPSTVTVTKTTPSA